MCYDMCQYWNSSVSGGTCGLQPGHTCPDIIDDECPECHEHLDECVCDICEDYGVHTDW